MCHHPTLDAPSRPRTLPLTALTAIAAAVFTGCAAAPLTGEGHFKMPLTHVHGIVKEPASDGFLLGTHNGIFTITSEGDLGPRLADTNFDAMVLTVVENSLIVSGHPGRSTPPELGSPHLGIIRSSDNGETWQPTAFTGKNRLPGSTRAQSVSDLKRRHRTITKQRRESRNSTNGAIPQRNLTAGLVLLAAGALLVLGGLMV